MRPVRLREREKDKRHRFIQERTTQTNPKKTGRGKEGGEGINRAGKSWKTVMMALLSGEAHDADKDNAYGNRQCFLGFMRCASNNQQQHVQQLRGMGS